MDPAAIAILTEMGKEILPIIVTAVLGIFGLRGAAQTVNTNTHDETLDKLKIKKIVHVVAGQHGKAGK